MHDSDDNRREFLVRLLALGMLTAAPSAFGNLLGKRPRRLPAGKSIYYLNGQVTVDGSIANENTLVQANSTIKTGSNSQLVFAVGHDAFILRENSSLELSAQELLVGGLRLISGALLSVFGKSEHHISTQTAYIGIRGTGVYLEAEAEQSYICTCYGTTDINSIANPQNSETIISQHHDAPRYVGADGSITPAPFINHTDEELMLIETLVGRTTPFGLFDENYSGPRRY